MLLDTAHCVASFLFNLCCALQRGKKFSTIERHVVTGYIVQWRSKVSHTHHVIQKCHPHNSYNHLITAKPHV